MAHFVFDIICEVPHSSLQSTSKWPVTKKKFSSRSVLKRPRESQWMVALSVTEKKTLEKKKILTGFFPWRAKSRSFATRRCSLWGCERACSLLFRQREPSFQNDYHLSLSLSLTLTFPLINDARKWRRRAASLGHREITRANSPLKRKKILVKP